MRFQHIIEQVYFQPWYITPSGHFAIHAILESRLGLMPAGEAKPGTPLPRAGLMEDLFIQRRPMTIDSDGIATVHILGPLGRGLSKLEKSCGATDFADVQAEIRDAVAKGAKGLILDINSPGGTVSGTPETARLVAAKSLPTVAFVDDLMASAAYYIGAGADAIVAEESAVVGSIGVYIPWMDYSERIRALGYKPAPIVNKGGDLKALGFGGSLSDAQRSYLQDMVDADFNAFKNHVRAYRDVPDSAMRGQIQKGQEALASSLVDELGDRPAALAKLRSLIAARRS
ncbi:MAG: S49 family peptidase [Opitutaceae bacterium]|nr:S49 family peptidase [Opitutaceae bacterium]